MKRKSAIRALARAVTMVVTSVVFLVMPGVSKADADAVVINELETAGISGFAESWNEADPGARVADAVHRSLLIRFPGSARAIARGLAEGAEIERAEVVFSYGGYEINPPKYMTRQTHREKWKKNPPRWHYVGWALRRPWTGQDEKMAPTFNAWINGAAYWARYGARDQQRDRYPEKFGPTEVSHQNTEGRMDVTGLLTDETYGESLGQRLRRFEQRGLLIRKWETYDVRYEDWSAYAWAVATGGHGLIFEDARLEVQFKDGPKTEIELPPARDLRAVAENLKDSPRGGEPTAVMPDESRVEEIAEKHAFQQPEWMPDWQWQRVRELRALGGGRIDRRSKKLLSGDPEQYREVVNRILRTVPRYWLGWHIQEQLILYHMYGDAFPPYVHDHLKAYWEAWLYPDRPNEEINVSPQGQEKFDWYEETGDWRGRFSFFRRRWTQGIGTMNFNHTANMGALLGGAMIDSKHAMQDGRDGLEDILLRVWAFLDGTSQEMLDDYYFSITLSGQKMFSDFGPSPVDRLMGDMIRNRAVELLASSFHPHLRRVVAPGGRVRMSNVLGYEQEGTYSVLHTLTPRGVLFHTDKGRDARQHGMHLFGYDFPPGRVAIQSVTKPWLPEWGKHWLEDKPLPYRVTAASTTRGHFTDPPLWRRGYLGHYYALASQDIMGATLDVTAQWHGGPKKATDADQLGTLSIRYNINEPHMAETSGGTMPYTGGLASYQQDNRVIVASKPPHDPEQVAKLAGDGLRRLYTSIALWNFADPPGWDVYVDGDLVDDIPVSLEAGQAITVRDGNAYLGILPLPCTNLGRDHQVRIEAGTPEPLGDRHKGVKIAPALMINSYNLDRDAAVNPSENMMEAITSETYGGFVVEMGDVEEYGSFEAFQEHIHACEIRREWDDDERMLHVAYRSGEDLMEMGFGVEALQPDPPHYEQIPGKQDEAIPYRRFNGENPFPQKGVERDTTLTQQGTTGRLEKKGAVLKMDPGRKGYLQTEPVSGTYVGYNPFPDLTDWSLTVPGDMEVRSDGPVGLLIVSVRPTGGTVRVRNAYRSDQLRQDVAERLLVFGRKDPPRAVVNGRALKELEKDQVDGREAYVIPLVLKTKE